MTDLVDHEGHDIQYTGSCCTAVWDNANETCVRNFSKLSTLLSVVVTIWSRFGNVHTACTSRGVYQDHYPFCSTKGQLTWRTCLSALNCSTGHYIVPYVYL